MDSKIPAVLTVKGMELQFCMSCNGSQERQNICTEEIQTVLQLITCLVGGWVAGLFCPESLLASLSGADNTLAGWSAGLGVACSLSRASSSILGQLLALETTSSLETVALVT